MLSISDAQEHCTACVVHTKSVDNGLCGEQICTAPVSLGCVVDEKLYRQPHGRHVPVSVGVEFSEAGVLCTDCFDKKPAKAKAPIARALHPFGD